jgi:hypothetical protein
MSADPTTTPTPPTRPIPVSTPADYEPPPRFRWVAPLAIGVALGAVIGCGVTFTMMSLSTRSRGELTARQFDVNRTLQATPGGEHLFVSTDTNSELGAYNRRGTGTNVVRRRITLSGQLAEGANASVIANNLKAAIDAELARAGSWSSGGGSSSSSGGSEFTGWFESTYYTRDGRRGQVDLDVDAKGKTFRATILLFEAK